MQNKNMVIALSIFLMSTITISVFSVYAQREEIPIYEVMKANYAGPFFGINLPYGVESPAFIQNVTQLAKMGFDSP
jgi:hypothetical protein